MSEDPSFPPEGNTSDTAPLAGVLTVTAPGTQAGRSVTVEPHGTTVGRDAACDLALASEYIARHQAVVRAHRGLYFVEDLGSINQTRLNGEPVTGTRPLSDGDRLTFADVEVQFRLMPMPTAPRRSSPAAGEDWHPAAETTPLAPMPEGPKRPLRQELRESPGFSASALMLGVLGAVVMTVLTGVTGAGPWGTLVGAGIGPVVTTTFTTKKAGEKGRVRTAAIVILSATALLITWAGIGVADQAAGKSLVPGEDRSNTFPMFGNAPAVPAGTSSTSVPGTATPTTSATSVSDKGPRSSANPRALNCGTAAVRSTVNCPAVTVTNTGSGTLRITGVEITGDNNGDFIRPNQCIGADIAPGASCEMGVGFQPSGGGVRRATLVINQNVPPPDTGTRVELAGVGAVRGT